jgi:drug/metabolite transporter (DMT)-like permease
MLSRHPRLLAIFLMILVALTGPLIGFSVKTAMAEGMDNPNVVFWRCLLGLVSISPMIWLWRREMAVSEWWVLMLRGAGLALSMSLYFWTYRHLSIANAQSLQMTAPLMLPFIAWVYLKENLRVVAIFSVVMGFAGAVLIVRPSSDFGSLEVLAGGLLSAFIGISLQVHGKGLIQKGLSARALSVFMIVGTTIGVAFIPPVTDGFVLPSFRSAFFLTLAGFMANMSWLWVILAYRHLDTATYGGLMYLVIPASILFDWLAFSHIPDLWSLSGIALIIGANMIPACFKPKIERVSS